MNAMIEEADELRKMPAVKLRNVLTKETRPELLRYLLRVDDRVNVQMKAKQRLSALGEPLEGPAADDGPNEPEEQQLRTCPRCKETGDITTGFGWRTINGKQRPQPWCKRCRSRRGKL